MKLVFVGVGLLLFYGWIFGGDDNNYLKLHIPPSPPPS